MYVDRQFWPQSNAKSLVNWDFYDEVAELCSKSTTSTLNLLLWLSRNNVGHRSWRTQQCWKHIHPHQQLPLKHNVAH